MDYNAALVLSLVAWWQWLGSNPRPGWLLGAMLALLLIAWSMGIMAHEFGHVIAARLVGLDPYVVIAGSGRTVLRANLGRLTLDLGWFPSTGLTLFGSKRSALLRLRTVVTLAGGPCMTFIVLVGALVLALQTTSTPSSTALDTIKNVLTGSRAEGITAHGLLTAACVLSSFAILITSALPIGNASGPRGLDSDLVSILRLVSTHNVPLPSASVWARQREFARSLALRQYDEAERYALQGLERTPNARPLRRELMSMLLAAGLYRQAEYHLRHLLGGADSQSEGEHFRSLAHPAAALAEGLLMAGESELALYWSAKAMQLDPEDSQVRAKCAGIVTQLGGWKKLDEADESHEADELGRAEQPRAHAPQDGQTPQE